MHSSTKRNYSRTSLSWLHSKNLWVIAEVSTWQEFTPESPRSSLDYYGEKHPAIVNLLFGGVAGMLGQSSSYPLDIVRRRMQTARKDKNGRYPYETIVGTLKTIFREEGIKGGFFKGLSMNWIKGPVAVGISFASYDSIRTTLREICNAYNQSSR